jgi:hypothetical protein
VFALADVESGIVTAAKSTASKIVAVIEILFFILTSPLFCLSLSDRNDRQFDKR